MRHLREAVSAKVAKPEGKAEKGHGVMANELPWFQFYVADWIGDPKLGRCSPATRGIWIDLICAMHADGRTGSISGDLDELARLGHATALEFAKAVEELRKTGAADVTECNGVVTLTNRRMKRDHDERQAVKNRVHKHREQKQNASETPSVTTEKRSGNAVESLVISQKSEEERSIHKASSSSYTSAPRKAQALSADDLVAYFQAQPVYAPLDIPMEVGLCIDWWSRNKGRPPSQRAVGNWLSKAMHDAPLLVNGHGRAPTRAELTDRAFEQAVQEREELKRRLAK